MECQKVAQDFASILEELTCNSRPIITTLTKTAEENIACAQQLVDAIERRIERCVPNQKLYAFYVMDSICKNAGSPYTIYFSRNLAKLYKRTYLLVDNQTRSSLIRLFQTWLNHSSSTMGDHLFGKEALDAIEQFLIKASTLQQKKVALPTVSGLLHEIDKLASLTKERASQNSQDPRLNTKILVLKQLKQELQRESLAPQALQEVQSQLRKIFSQEQQMLRKQQQQQQPSFQNVSQNSSAVSSTPSQEQTPTPGDSEMIPLFGPTSSSAFFPNAVNILPPSDSSRQVNRVQSLYDSLAKEGLIRPVQNQSIVRLESVLAQNSNEISKITLPSLHLLRNILGDIKSHFSVYGVDILNTPNLQLCQQTIIEDNPAVAQLKNLLYRYKPNKCSSCGKRFGTTEDEKKRERDHLDWHFRINKRIKGTSGVNGTAVKNIQSRNWYLDDTQWQQFDDEEIVSTTRLKNDTFTLPRLGVVSEKDTFDEVTSTQNKAIATDESNLAKKRVVVPESSVEMSFQCPICREEQSAVYDDDTGEWVWPNCVESQGKYFHATCFHEAASSAPQQALHQGLERLKGLAG
ncbi:LAME_0D08702g1_1 [Lachancea meyersii CBS 8951]|uniref:LAME_0D08702g1_1 n=1 Tax=Lachancea meyersii CBS 8951 TaxID=1266667 RepID=A0A1G4JAP6_9SACH|nr:LAME_0D08702g1_1 [Lachancea meyersii CBS 8951]